MQASHANVHAGVTYPVHHLRRTAFGPQQDPSHTGLSVAQQLQNNHGGFIDDYAQTYPGDPDIDKVMGYTNGADLPRHDFLAQDFAPQAQAQAGELADVAAVPVQSEAEAGVIAAHRHLARSARSVQAAHGKAAPLSVGRCRRQGGKLPLADAGSGGKSAGA